MLSAEADYRKWLDKATNDLLNIENNLAAEQVPWDTVCFHAQQCAEKLLKAFLVYHEMRPPRTHDLSLLLSDCVTIEPQLSTLEDPCRRLTAYAVSGRYPDVFDVEEDEGRQALASLDQIRTALLPLLPAAGVPVRIDTNSQVGD